MRNLRRLIDASRNSPAIDYFARAAYVAVASAGGRGNLQNLDPAEIVRRLYGTDDPVTANLLTRAAVAPGTTTTSGWASEIAPIAFGSFLVGLGPLSAAAQIIGQGLSVRLAGENSFSAPQRSGARATLPWVEEGEPIPVHEFLLNSVSVGPPRKFATIVAFAAELARRSDAESVFTTMLREEASQTLDAAYFSTTAGSDSAHVGLLNGVASIAGYAGGDDEAIKTDFAALAGAVAADGSGRVIYVMAPARAARLPIIAPEIASRLEILPSLAVGANVVIAVDPLSLVHAFDDAPEIMASREAVIHMSDDPDPISDSGTAAPVRSLWQTDAVALRVIGDVAFAKRRSGAVAWVDAATW